jgi:hypothetical protein
MQVAADPPPTHLLLQLWVIHAILSRPGLQHADDVQMLLTERSFRQPVVVSGFWPARAQWWEVILGGTGGYRGYATFGPQIPLKMFAPSGVGKTNAIEAMIFFYFDK